MKRSITSIISAIDALNERVGQGVSWLTTALVLITMADVTTRYLFQESQAWILELEWHFFALVFLLGAGFALKHDRHVRVDLFYDKFKPRDKASVNFWGTLLLLLPWCALVIWSAWPFAIDAWTIREGSPDPGGLPARYLIKFAMIAGVGLLGLQGLAELLRSALLLFGAKTENA